jgi:hypothetical protein
MTQMEIQCEIQYFMSKRVMKNKRCFAFKCKYIQAKVQKTRLRFTGDILIISVRILT